MRPAGGAVDADPGELERLEAQRLEGARPQGHRLPVAGGSGEPSHPRVAAAEGVGERAAGTLQPRLAFRSRAPQLGLGLKQD